jgi:hypothetical protein
MAITMNLIDQDRGLEVRCEGEITGGDVLQAQQSYSPQEIGQLRYILIDYCGVTVNRIDEQEVEAIAVNDRERLNLHPDLLMVAIVPNDIFQLLTKLWMAYADVDSERFKHFETRQEAKAWIQSRLAQ